MHALAPKRLSRISILIISALVFSGCGQGDGPKSIAGTPATPVPELPAGFCDAINFETLCEPPIINNFNGGATIIIDNPDMSGINVSEKVARMQKFADEVFGGTKLDLAESIDFANGEFYKVKVWSPRPVTVSFKLEETGNPDGGLTKDVDHSGGSAWEELCFDFTGQAVPPPVVALTIIFDLGVLGQAAVDPDNWTFYYDDIEQVTSCAGSGGGVAIDPDSTLYSTAGDPDLVIPDDYAELTPFGSVSIIDPFYADDDTYSPVLAVTSGVGYNANVAQIGYIGFRAGFAGAYETLDFKIKGMPNQVLFVKLFDNIDALRINLTSSAYSDALGDDWFQVSIPISSFTGVDQATGIVFESDNTAPMQFTMFLTDIGFSGTGTGGPQPADPGLIPDDVIFASDPGETVDLVATVSAFGTTSQFDGAYALDADFNPAFEVISGTGYGIPHIAQLGLVGLPAGFATGYESFSFKIKSADLPGNLVTVKLEAGGVYGDVVLTDTTVSTALGNGWYQVVLPMSGFANVDPAVGVVFEAQDQTTGFSFLLTDIGFNNPAGGGGADPGLIPDDVIYATDPGEVIDLVATVSAFGTTSQFDGAYALDADFNPAFEVISGTGYGIPHIAQLGLVGLPAGFATGYESFSFKIKSADLPGNLVTVKLEAGGVYGDVVLTDTTVSTALGNGWYQVVLPMSGFANVDPAVGVVFEAQDQTTGFSFLLTDIGFNNPAGGGGADPGLIPDDVIYATDPGEVIDLVATVSAFGTTSQFDGAYALDADFNPAFEVISGTGYGIPHIAQLGLVGLPAGFATGYESFSFKIKSADLPGNLVTVKLEAGGVYGDVVLTDTTVSTALGNGWYQVVLPMSGFANVDPAVGVVFEAQDQTTGFSFLLTDIGFNNPAGGGSGELVPDGGFEAAGVSGLQVPWFTFANGGTAGISNANSNGGTYSARLQADASSGAPSFPQLKVEGLGAGSLTDGGPVTITFDAIDVDNTGVGKVFVAEFFTERADPPGGATNEVILGGYGLSAAWTTYTFNTNLGADATRGVSLLFKADCGANPVCTMDVFIDNVSIVVP